MFFSPVVSFEGRSSEDAGDFQARKTRSSVAGHVKASISPPALRPGSDRSAGTCMERQQMTISLSRLSGKTLSATSREWIDWSPIREETERGRHKVAGEPFRRRMESMAATLSRLSRDEAHHFTPIPDSPDSSGYSGEALCMDCLCCRMAKYSPVS